MKLLTEELVKKFEEYPLYSQDGKMGNAKVIAKFFNPMGQGTWLITEGDIIRDEQGNIEDVEMFGFVNLVGMDYAELGYVSLNELQSVKLPFGLTIERDLYYPEDINLRDACQNEFGEVPEIFMAKALYTIYQLKQNDENHFLRYTGLSHLKNGIDDIKATNYEKVYEAYRDAIDMEDSDETFYACESLFSKFNNTAEMPSDFTGHLLSVSDVIVLECDGISKAYYCDTFGFKEIPSFIEQINEKNKLRDILNSEKAIKVGGKYTSADFLKAGNKILYRNKYIASEITWTEHPSTLTLDELLDHLLNMQNEGYTIQIIPDKEYDKPIIEKLDNNEPDICDD